MKKLIAKLDRIFSEYIRLRDSNHEGYCQCISSGNVYYWKDIDCGHFINRKHMSTRYNEKNCNAQSRSDNRFDEGNALGYAIGLIGKYGKGILEELEEEKFKTKKYTPAELEELCVYYREKVKELKKSKTLK